MIGAHRFLHKGPSQNPRDGVDPKVYKEDWSESNSNLQPAHKVTGQILVLESYLVNTKNAVSVSKNNTPHGYLHN